MSELITMVIYRAASNTKEEKISGIKVMLVCIDDALGALDKWYACIHSCFTCERWPSLRQFQAGVGPSDFWGSYCLTLHLTGHSSLLEFATSSDLLDLCLHDNPYFSLAGIHFPFYCLLWHVPNLPLCCHIHTLDIITIYGALPLPDNSCLLDNHFLSCERHLFLHNCLQCQLPIWCQWTATKWEWSLDI